MPGEGGFFGGGGGGSGFGGTNLRATARPLRGSAFERSFALGGVFSARLFTNAFRVGTVARLTAATFFPFATAAFLAGRFAGFLEAETFLLLFAAASFFDELSFWLLGVVVIRPGRVGLRDEDFFPFARIFCGAGERLFVALVIRPLIVLLGVENEPAPINPAVALVYGCSYTNNPSASQENTSAPHARSAYLYGQTPPEQAEVVNGV